MKFTQRVAAASTALLLGTAVCAQTPQPAPPQAPMTQQQINEEMLKELKAIHALLERLTDPTQAQGPPASAKLVNLKGFAMGRPDAPLTMVEFTDLQCPYCRQYATATFEQIKKDWIDTGKLRYISRDFPLDIHPQALAAARAARCAGEQGHFWEMRFVLMRNASLLSPDYIARTAAEMKLDSRAFAACAASTTFDADIRADMQEGLKIGVEGTPTFVIGRSAPTSVEGPMIVGALAYTQFDAKLKELLTK